MTIFADLMQYPSSHSRECLRQNRCVCGHYERQNADFEARLKQAMERYPNQPQYDHAEHKRFMRGL
jgi:hypothetical protein